MFVVNQIICLLGKSFLAHLRGFNRSYFMVFVKAFTILKATAWVDSMTRHCEKGI